MKFLFIAIIFISQSAFGDTYENMFGGRYNPHPNGENTYLTQPTIGIQPQQPQPRIQRCTYQYGPGIDIYGNREVVQVCN